MTTLEDVRRCPKCEFPGKDAGGKRRPDKSTLYSMECDNKRCKWFGEHWVYQVRSDGTLVDAQTKRPKQFPTLPGTGEAFLAGLDAELNRSMGRPS